jgi:hypothetical protein
MAGEITGGSYFLSGFLGFRWTIYDNTPSGAIDEVELRLYRVCGADKLQLRLSADLHAR